MPFFLPCDPIYPIKFRCFLNSIMGSDGNEQRNLPPRALIVGSYCHDVIIRDGVVVTESLGGAASFISVVFDALSVPYKSVAKVGTDFAYSINQNPIIVSSSQTTSFHAFFDSASIDEDGHSDRVLKRVRACDPIRPSDLPAAWYDFGMAVGVGGEILPETLERMLDICKLVFVDVQALIRVFDDVDGAVKLVNLKDSGFFHLLPRIGFLKGSAEEAPFMDVEEVRKLCSVVITNGKDGCKLYMRDGETPIEPFPAKQVDPTGAGDSFLGGLAAGLVQGFSVPDAALLGNLFGSLTVEQMGLPKFDSRLLQRVKEGVNRRKKQNLRCHDRRDERSTEGHEEFHATLEAIRGEQSTQMQPRDPNQNHQAIT